jgi:hypothetical protein
VVKRLVRAYTIHDTTLVSLIRGVPNYRRKMPDDVLTRIINHEMLLEEARYVKNLSMSIVSSKKDKIALMQARRIRRSK